MLQAISPYIPQKEVVRSHAQLKKLLLRRKHPKSVEFQFDDPNIQDKNALKRVTASLSKHIAQLKTPPMKEILKNKNLAKAVRHLQVKPEDAYRHITQITRKFYRMKIFLILDEKDSFTPMRIKGKVQALRLLRKFVYDHEFCQKFMKCAIYAQDLKIRKTSLNFQFLPKFQRLKNLFLILKTKYLVLPEEDDAYIEKLKLVLLRLPNLKNVWLEQEIDPENYPQVFLNLSAALRHQVRVGLVADFVEMSNPRPRENAIERTLERICEAGVSHLKIYYVGIINVLKRLGRSFYAPIHVRKELYERFVNAIIHVPFLNIQYAPTIHSSYIDSNFQTILRRFMELNSKFQMPMMSVIYHLDLIEQNTFEILQGLYNYPVPSYDLVIINTTCYKKGLTDLIHQHFLKVFEKIQEYNAECSLQITTKNLHILGLILEMLSPKINLVKLKSLSLQIIEPISQSNFPTLFKLLKKSEVWNTINKLEINVSQRETPSLEGLFKPLSLTGLEFSQLDKLSLLYHNVAECRDILKETFEKLRSQNSRIDFTYEVNEERLNFQ